MASLCAAVQLQTAPQWCQQYNLLHSPYNLADIVVCNIITKYEIY